METWKDVEGYEGIYQVSNTGKVRNIIKCRPVKTKKNNRDYVQIRLYKNGEVEHWLLHRLVAKHFIDNPESLPQVNHKDEDKDNNNYTNLEWCDNTYNRHYGTGIARMAMNHDYEKMARRLYKPIHQYDKEGNHIKRWESIQSASLHLAGKKDAGAISACLRGKNKTAYGYVWKYA